MSAAVNEKLGPLLTELGNEISAQLGGLPKRAYLYAACEGDWAQVALYVDEGDRVVSYKPDQELFNLAMEIWTADNGKRAKKLRWLLFDYDISDGKFRTRFVFPEEMPPGIDVFDWDDTAVKERFGDKPMIQIGWDDPPPP